MAARAGWRSGVTRWARDTAIGGGGLDEGSERERFEVEGESERLGKSVVCGVRFGRVVCAWCVCVRVCVVCVGRGLGLGLLGLGLG